MGNTSVGRRSNSKNDAAVTEAAASRRVVVTSRKLRRRRDVVVAGGGVAPAAAGTVVTVKVVMRRKDAEALVARLDAQTARARKARMAELKGELRAAAGGGASPASCRDACWSPQLAPIKEK